MSNFSKAAYFSTFVLFLVLAVVRVEGRFLRSNATELVSDGVGDGVQPDNDSYLFFKGIESSESDQCKQMYGFLPCSNNMFGHLFLILVYEYLLFRGESYLAAGGKQTFKILGPGVFGASSFDILGALPESLILLASGLIGNKEAAQEYAITGVGLLAGSSILLLTFVWGTCVLTGKQRFRNDPYGSNSSRAVNDYSNSGGSNGSNSSKEYQNDSNSSSGGIKELLKRWLNITKENETTYMAIIMVLSILPPTMMQIPNLFPFSSSLRTITLIIALIVTVIFLVFYLIYQLLEPHIHKLIRLQYVEHDHLFSIILQEVPEHTLQSILTMNGTPNENAINKLFEVLDRNNDKVISRSELKELLVRTRLTDTNINEEEEIGKLLKIFDKDGNQEINREEFVDGFTEWVIQVQLALDKQCLSRKAMQNIYKVFKPWLENIRKEREKKQNLMSAILTSVESDMGGLSDNSNVYRFFEKFDSNGDEKISKAELTVLVKNLKSGIASIDVEDAVKKITEEFDIDKDNEISYKEFVAGIEKLREPSLGHAPASTSPFANETNLQALSNVEKLIQENHSKGLAAWFKALLKVVIGIITLSLLAEPLISSVQNFSQSAGIPSFFTSFIVVPLAINFREATLAIKKASHDKKKSTTSETAYEIYDAVFMNNILGFFAISILIYARDITWEFSAELLVLAMVCAIMGLITEYFRSKFPLQTSIAAYLLYPSSLVFAFYLNDVLNYI